MTQGGIWYGCTKCRLAAWRAGDTDPMFSPCGKRGHGTVVLNRQELDVLHKLAKLSAEAWGQIMDREDTLPPGPFDVM